MKIINTTIGFNRSYSIIPDTLKSLLGYSTNSKSFSILNVAIGSESINSYRSVEDIKNDLLYAGYITIEEPGNIISYQFEGDSGLDHVTIDELVDVIKHQQMLDTLEVQL